MDSKNTAQTSIDKDSPNKIQKEWKIGGITFSGKTTKHEKRQLAFFQIYQRSGFNFY
jgi:hypothetical protein